MRPIFHCFTAYALFTKLICEANQELPGLVLAPCKGAERQECPKISQMSEWAAGCTQPHPAQSTGAAVLSGTGNLRENPAASPCQENAPLLPHCQCKVLCRQPAGRGPSPESLPEQGEQGKATCGLLLGPVQGQELGSDDPCGLLPAQDIQWLSDSPFPHTGIKHLPGKGTTCQFLCQVCQGMLQPSTAEGTVSSVPTQHIPDMEYYQAHPELGVSHRALWDCARGTALPGKPTVPTGKQRQLPVCAAWALQAPALAFSLQTNGISTTCVSTSHWAGTRFCSGGLCGGHSRGNPQEELQDCSSITQCPCQSQQSCGLVIFDLSQPPKFSFSLQNKAQNQLVCPSPVWSLLVAANDTNNGQEPPRGAEE